MKKTWVGIWAAAALLTGGASLAADSTEVTGKVVKTSSNEVQVEQQGTVIPIKINANTQFQDPSIQRARDLKEGQEISANIEVQKTDNVAKSISLAPAQGGSGLPAEDSKSDLDTDLEHPDTGMNQDRVPGDGNMMNGTGANGDQTYPTAPEQGPKP